jgi:hypothetical protein
MLSTWVGTVGNGITPYGCSSSSVLYARATPAGAAALSGAWEYFVARHEGERVPCENWNAKVKGADGRCRTAPAVDWEERTFNMMLLRHSIGLGDEQAPLRQRLLPANRFVDGAFIPNGSQRVVAVHAGSAGDFSAKLAMLDSHGLLRRGMAAQRRFVRTTQPTLDVNVSVSHIR